ncbi:MAG: hypothetical protein JWN03_3993 [Nocardia sp.]|uniref:hypothetical protein n=1 Tax=Nocardia sp. TaxID=1821 RepID=UPI0026052A71|nr:hypothetical protein [Nocardia sp.]MCU1643718.1 hypothetical protein [Nocardia sp.]
MRLFATLPILVLSGVVTLGLTACDDTADKAQSTVAATSSASSGAPQASATTLPEVRCGVGDYGLTVVAYTAKGADFCPTAKAVANAYSQALVHDQHTGDTALTVDNLRWVCGERQGEDSKTYPECSSQNESAEKIRLVPA